MKTFWKQLHLILTLHCDEASQLMSDSLDRPLKWYERWAVRMHLLLCWSCRQFRKHLDILSKAFGQLSDPRSDSVDTVQLSTSRKQELKQLLAERDD